MSQLNYLEKLLDGVEVEWTTLGNEHAVEIANSGRKPVKAALRLAGETPYYGANNIQDYVDGYTHDGEFVLIAEDGSASLENYSIQYATGRFWANNHVHVVRGKEVINTRYLYHYLCIVNFVPFLSGGGRAKLTKGKLVDIPLPIPCPDSPEKSLAIQAEIVRILDAFTALTAELTAELNMRKKQYNHYRDQLLSFDLSADQAGEGDVEWKRLEEIGHIVTGRTPKSSDKSAWGDDVDFVTPSDIKNGMRNITCPSRRLSAEGAASMPKVRIPSGSLLVTCIGADMGKTVINANDCIPNQQINAITLTDDNVQVGYLFHVLTAMRETLRRQGELGGGTMPLINKSDFSKIVVPVPSYEEQNRIATILDKFDALTNSITEGLPREIELRQKQYEYYRDLLLSFPKSDEAA